MSRLHKTFYTLPACTNDGSIEVSWIDSPFSQLTYYWYDGHLHNFTDGQELAVGDELHNIPQGYYTLLILASSGCRAEYEFYVPSAEEALFSPPCIHPADINNQGGILLPYQEGYTYSWVGDAGANGPVLYPVPAGDYTVHIEGPGGEFACSSDFTYTVPPCSDYEFDFSLSATPVYQEDGSFGGIILSQEI